MLLKRAKSEQPDSALGSRSDYMRFKPRERIVFHSDYFRVDGGYATIMSFFHLEGADDNFGAFWGVNRIPSGLDHDIVTINFEQVKRLSEDWLATKQTKAEGVAEANENAQSTGGTNTARHKARKTSADLQTIAQELTNGASYLNVRDRIMVKAPTLEKLDKAVEKIERLYLDRFHTLSASSYIGRQRKELSTLLLPNARKEGKGFYYTSVEFAGAYSLVTHGLEDATGEYVGSMVGDVNNSAVVFDANGFTKRAVVVSEQRDSKNRRVCDLWAQKIAQSVMCNGHRVVHLLLHNTDLFAMGPAMPNLTRVIDLNVGDLNMFEMFGDVEDELSVFPTQMQKLVLMAEQAYETTDSDRSIIRGSLEDVATKFYIDNRMWAENAKANRSRLRVVGIPHEQVPKLEMFVSYLDMEYKALVNAQARDDEKLHAMSVLATTFRNLLSNNGDLFNTVTNPVIDEAALGRRVIYDFSRLSRRGHGVAMAQLVNVIGFAVGALGRGDCVIFHGAQNIDPGVMDYLRAQMSGFIDDGGRVVYAYFDNEAFLKNKAFNRFDEADYTIMGTMSRTMIMDYQEKLGTSIPADLARLVTTKSSDTSYIRRGFENVVFRRDLKLDPVADALAKPSSRLKTVLERMGQR